MDFSDALKEFLETQNKSLDDLKGSLGLVEGGESASEAVTDEPKVVVDKTNSSRSYRRLRLFSGRTPTPTGELDFENWRRLARQLIKDKSVSDGEKRSRVTESLVPPALDVVWAVGEGASASDYLDCLSKAYGSTADGDELLTLFRCEYQKESEKASDYLLRLHTMLTRVIEKGGVDQNSSSKLLCNQFQRGCLYNDHLLHTLQLQNKKTNPPAVLELLREVRVAETQLEEKMGRKAAHRSPPKKVSVMEQTIPTPPTKVMLHTPMAAPSPSSEVEELRQAVDRLHRRLDGLFKSQSNSQRGNSHPGRREIPGLSSVIIVEKTVTR